MRQYRIARTNRFINKGSWIRRVNPKFVLKSLAYCLIIFKSREIKPSHGSSDSNKYFSLHQPLKYAREKKEPKIQLPTNAVLPFLLYLEHLSISPCLIQSFSTPVDSLVDFELYKVRVSNHTIQSLFL